MGNPMLKQPLNLPSQEFEAHLYDCDGTLADTMTPHIEAWVAECNAHGVPLDGNMITELAGMPAVPTVERINARYGSKLDPHQIAQLKEDRFHREYLHRVKPIQEVVDVLEQAYAKGIKIGVVSGGRKRIVEETLKMLNIRDKVGVVICAEDVVNGKPHAEPFLKAAQALGVKPEKCLVFEDADLGIKSAENANMQWVRVYS